MTTTKLGWAGGGVVAAVLLAALGWGLVHPANPASTIVGRPAPGLVLQTLDGDTVTLASQRGHPVVVNFWASWCPPCRSEGPVLKRAAVRHSGTVGFLGVDIQDSVEAARAYQSQASQPYPVGPALAGSEPFGVRSPPQTFFIDSAGTVVASFTGPLDAGVLERYLGLVGAR